MLDVLVPIILLCLFGVGIGLIVLSLVPDGGGWRGWVEQAFWLSIQIGVAVGGGVLIAELIVACCYSPSYMEAPRFYRVTMFIGVLFMLPATRLVSSLIDRFRSKLQRIRKKL